MLITFRVENHRSLRDEQALSMEMGEQVLPVAAIFGANASGKSNVLNAIGFMRNAVVHSHRSFDPEEGVPHCPFAWGSMARKPSLYEISFREDGVLYEYGFAADAERFVEEWLHAYPSSRRQVWFEREGQTFKFGEQLKGENRVVQNLTRPNSLFLSAAAQNHHQQLEPVYRWFARMRARNSGVFAAARERRELSEGEEFVRWWKQRPSKQLSMFEGAPEWKKNVREEQFRSLLRASDFGIVDVQIGGEDGDSDGGLERPRVRLKHQSSVPNAWLRLEQESHGTRQLFRLAPPILDALATGGVVLIDELESSFHPLLAAHLLSLFEDRKQNPRGAQLIFTTHDTALMGSVLGEPSLKREQVWLTEKDDEGATRLYPLTDYKPRKEENLERGYLQGRYGAIPFLGGQR